METNELMSRGKVNERNEIASLHCAVANVRVGEVAAAGKRGFQLLITYYIRSGSVSPALRRLSSSDVFVIRTHSLYVYDLVTYFPLDI